MAGAGLMMIGAPTAIAGATLCAVRFSGKLNGAIPSTGPIGKRRTRAARPAAAGSVSRRWNSPLKRRASSAAHRKVEATRWVSALAHMSGLPFSAVMSRAISSARAVTLVETCMSASARTAAGWAAVSWRAAQAAATARSTCSGLGTACRPTTDPS